MVIKYATFLPREMAPRWTGLLGAQHQLVCQALSSGPALTPAREGGREGGRERGREGGREGRREGGNREAKGNRGYHGRVPAH